MRNEMKAAYALISKFKHGEIEPGSPITKEEGRLVRLLAADLDVSGENSSIEQLVVVVAKSDTVWNKRTQTVVNRIYSLREAGDLAKAEEERQAFLGSCPSTWYCGIVGSL